MCLLCFSVFLRWFCLVGFCGWVTVFTVHILPICGVCVVLICFAYVYLVFDLMCFVVIWMWLIDLFLLVCLGFVGCLLVDC